MVKFSYKDGERKRIDFLARRGKGFPSTVSGTGQSWVLGYLNPTHPVSTSTLIWCLNSTEFAANRKKKQPQIYLFYCLIISKYTLELDELLYEDDQH